MRRRTRRPFGPVQALTRPFIRCASRWATLRPCGPPPPSVSDHRRPPPNTAEHRHRPPAGNRGEHLEPTTHRRRAEGPGAAEPAGARRHRGLHPAGARPDRCAGRIDRPDGLRALARPVPADRHHGAADGGAGRPTGGQRQPAARHGGQHPDLLGHEAGSPRHRTRSVTPVLVVAPGAPPERRAPDPRAVARPLRSPELPGQGLRVPLRLGTGVPAGGDGRVQRRHVRRSRRPARRGTARPTRATPGPRAHSGHPPGTPQGRRLVGPRPDPGLGGPAGQPGLAPQQRLPGHREDGCRRHGGTGRTAGHLDGRRGPCRPGGDRERARSAGPDQAALPRHVQQRSRPEPDRQSHGRADPRLPHRREEGPDQPRAGTGRRRRDRGLRAHVRPAEHSVRRDRPRPGAAGRPRHRCCDPGSGGAGRPRDTRVHQREEPSGRPLRTPRPADRTGRTGGARESSRPPGTAHPPRPSGRRWPSACGWHGWTTSSPCGEW